MPVQQSRNTLTVVIIDDDEEHLHLMRRALKRLESDGGAFLLPHQILTFTDPAEALAAFPPGRQIAVLCDYQMPGGSGIDWIADLKRAASGPVILMTSHGDQHIASAAFRAGASEYLIKSEALQKPHMLQRAILESLRRHRLGLRNIQMARELKTANLALAKKNEHLNQMTERAQRFVEDVAHEFRTPLTVIKEFGSIIRDGLGGPVTEKQVEYLAYIDNGVRDLTQLVNDFLDTSKLRSRTLRVHRARHAATSIYESVRQTMQTRAAEKQIKIDSEITDDLPDVFCDLEKVGRILINLIGNAIKFSPENSTIRVWAKPDAQGDVRFGVTDEGPGLSQTEQDNLFERFSQADTAMRATAKGFGLGLNIASDMARLNLSSLHIDSEPGQGSTFSFSLPFCDSERILHRYCQTLLGGHTDTDSDPTQEANLTLLRVSNPDGSVFTPEMIQRIAARSHTMDLILQTPDAAALILVGESNHPDMWIEKIRSVSQKSEKLMHIENTKPPPSLDVRWIGTWICPAMQGLLMTTASDHLFGTRRACA